MVWYSTNYNHTQIYAALLNMCVFYLTFKLPWMCCEQLGVQDLAKGCFDTWIEGTGNQSADLLIGKQPALKPEPQLP